MVFLHSKTFQLILPSQALLFNSSVRRHASYLRQLEQSFVALYCKHLSSAAQSSPTKHSFLQTGSKDKGSLYPPTGLGLLCHPGTESLDSPHCKPLIKFISKNQSQWSNLFQKPITSIWNLGAVPLTHYNAVETVVSKPPHPQTLSFLLSCCASPRRAPSTNRRLRLPPLLLLPHHWLL